MTGAARVACRVTGKNRVVRSAYLPIADLNGDGDLDLAVRGGADRLDDLFRGVEVWRVVIG